MFTPKYFPPHYFADGYWAASEAAAGSITGSISAGATVTGLLTTGTVEVPSPVSVPSGGGIWVKVGDDGVDQLHAVSIVARPVLPRVPIGTITVPLVAASLVGGRVTTDKPRLRTDDLIEILDMADMLNTLEALDLMDMAA